MKRNRRGANYHGGGATPIALGPQTLRTVTLLENFMVKKNVKITRLVGWSADGVTFTDKDRAFVKLLGLTKADAALLGEAGQ
jgi:hypothetical protein